MSQITYTCRSCGKQDAFESNGATQYLLDDDTPRPPTYIVKCSHCNAENSVTKD